MRRLPAALMAAALTALAVALPSEGRRLPGAPRCPVFPRSSHWNRPVDGLPVHRRSDAIVRAVGRADTAHADFGSGLYEGAPIGIPYRVVKADQKHVPVSFGYAAESDRGPYPIPPGVPVEGGRGSDGDRHVILVDRSRCRLYELFSAYPLDGGQRWRAGSGAIWSLRSNRMRPRGWTSADAAGLPILPGLVRYDEVGAGEIDHAIRITFDETRRAYLSPATHYASDLCAANLPPMGMRFRLRPGYSLAGITGQARVVAEALKRYGAITADNGTDWYITGERSRRWNDDNLNQLKEIPGDAFQVVNTGAELTTPC